MKKRLPLVLLAAFVVSAVCADVYADEPNKSFPNIEQILRDDTIPSKARAALAMGTVRVRVSRPNALIGMLVQSAEGSGFVVGEDEIVTCFHNLAISAGTAYYIDDAYQSVRVDFMGKTYPAKVMGADPLRDLALLKVVDTPKDKFTGRPILVSPLDLSKYPRRPWFALGFWAGGSAFLKEYRHFEGYFVNPELTGSGALKGGFDEPMDMGLSGSPIVDAEGECRGMVDRTSNAGTIFNPANEILWFLQTLKEK